MAIIPCRASDYPTARFSSKLLAHSSKYAMDWQCRPEWVESPISHVLLVEYPTLQCSGNWSRKVRRALEYLNRVRVSSLRRRLDSADNKFCWLRGLIAQRLA